MIIEAAIAVTSGSSALDLAVSSPENGITASTLSCSGVSSVRSFCLPTVPTTVPLFSSLVC